MAEGRLFKCNEGGIFGLPMIGTIPKENLLLGEGGGEERASNDGFNLRMVAITPAHNMTDMAIIFITIAQPQPLESAA